MAIKLDKTLKGFTHYTLREGNYFLEQTRDRVEHIKSGVYKIGVTMFGELYLEPQNVNSDALLNLPNTASQKILAEIEQFWEAKTKEKFKAYDLVYKRGILLFGPPGTGKTCTISQVMKSVIDRGGIVFFNPQPQVLVPTIERLREIEPDLKILIVWEEFDELVDSPTLLSLLDGQLQLDNIMYLATTNYIEDIPDRVKNRPSRFASVLEIGLPDANTRLAYLKAKLLPSDQQDLGSWVEKTQGMVLDQIKDVIVSVCCFGQNLTEAVAKIKTMNVQAAEANKTYKSDREFNYEVKMSEDFEKAKAVLAFGGEE